MASTKVRLLKHDFPPRSRFCMNHTAFLNGKADIRLDLFSHSLSHHLSDVIVEML